MARGGGLCRGRTIPSRSRSNPGGQAAQAGAAEKAVVVTTAIAGGGALRRLTVLHAVRYRQVRAVRALDGGGGSRSSSDKLPREKVEAEAAAKPSMRSPRVTRSTASTDPDGACCKPAVGARPRPAQSLHTGALTPPMVAARLMCWRLLHSLAPSPGTSLQSVGPPLPSRSLSPALRSQGPSRRRPSWTACSARSQ